MSASFPILTDLPTVEQNKVNALLAKAPALRLASETAYLNALAAYTSNKIIDMDTSGNILRCQSTSSPSNGGSGFAKDAEWHNISTATGSNGYYINVGTTTSAVWQHVQSA